MISGLRASAVTCYETSFTDNGLPPEVLTAEGLHEQTVDIALKAFREFAGTEKMVTTMVVAVYDTEKAMRFFPCEWRDEREKNDLLDGLRALFQSPDMRPDRYVFQGEVWLGTATSREEADRLPPRLDPRSLDGLTVLTVGGPEAEPIFTAYSRDKAGAIKPFADSRDSGDLTGSEGRLAELLKPLDGDATVAVIVA